MKGTIVMLAALLALLPVAGKAHGPHGATGTPTAEQQKAKDAARKRAQPLIGKWKLVDGDDDFEFGEDGIFRARSPEAELAGHFLVNEKGILELELGIGLGTKILRNWKVVKGKLTLSDTLSDLSWTYRRQP